MTFMSEPFSTLPLSRRGFLATVAAGSVAPAFVPSRCFGANEKVTLGFIGVGGQGKGNLGGFLKHANVAAVCDVDSKRLADALGVVEKAGGRAEGYADYRKLLERKDIDAVVISTPDHWHALPTVHACAAGKDVYVEKPLSLTIAEGRVMVDAARKHKRIVQTGSQQRSDTKFRRACELVRSGMIGQVEKVLVGIPNVNFSGPPVADGTAPPELDYNFWLGPARERPYNAKRTHYNFRFFWDYSGGQMTNFGAHHIDIAQWGLGTDDTGPVSVEGTAEYHPEKWYEVSMKCRVTHRYANGVEMIVGQGQRDIPDGTTFVGTKGTLFVNRGVLKTTPEEIASSTEPTSVSLYESASHHRNFLDCVKSRQAPICDVEIGHRSATICHLGNIACRLQRKLVWDPVGEKFVGDEEASREISRAYRSPWTLG
jgi:predicted dehydrogenase